jgi:hypothetical protein
MQLRREFGSDGSPDGCGSKTRPRGWSTRLEAMTVAGFDAAVLVDVPAWTVFSSKFGMLGPGAARSFGGDGTQ